MICQKLPIAVQIYANGDCLKKIVLTSDQKFSFFIQNGSKKLEDDFHMWMDSYYNQSPLPITHFQLELQGTLFQQTIWEYLTKIPFGRTLSYKDLGKKIGSEKYARAVGNACNKNPLPLLIPCHRIIQSNGHLGGFAYSKKLKEILLEFEKTQLN